MRRIDVKRVSFDALGDTITPVVTPRDRLGYPVADAVLAYSVSDSSIVEVGAGGRLHSAAPGHVTLSIRDAHLSCQPWIKPKIHNDARRCSGQEQGYSKHQIDASCRT